jgi:aspartate/methionine/tyrosine aminotransferase
LSLRVLGDSVSYGIFGKVAEMASRGRKVYPLAIGEPSFSTPKPIIEKAYEAMKNEETHYVSSFGTNDVREAIRAKARKRNHIKADISNTIFLTTKLSVYASLLATSVGGEVLIPDPGYFYHQPVILAGADPVRYRLSNDYSLDLGAIAQRASKRTKAIIVNTPSNPTGKMLGRGELRELLEFCKERRIWVISDEAYEDLVYSREHFSIGSLESEPDRVISLFSLSKSFAMTGWRAGYLIAHREIIALVNRFIEHTSSCFPPFIQAASAYALRRGRAHTRRFRDELRERRDLMEAMMRKIPRLHFARSEGAFYSFPEYYARMSSLEVCQKMLDATGVAVLPGSIFGPAGEKHLRISFAAPRETIQGGMRLVGEFLGGLPR